MTRDKYKEEKTIVEKHTRMCLLVLGMKVKENNFLLPGIWACWSLVNVFRLGQGLLRSEWSPYHSAPSEHSFLFFLVLPSDVYLQPQFTVVKKRQRKEKRNKMSLAHNVTAITSTSPMPWWAYCQKNRIFQYSRTNFSGFSVWPVLRYIENYLIDSLTGRLRSWATHSVEKWTGYHETFVVFFWPPWENNVKVPPLPSL